MQETMNKIKDLLDDVNVFVELNQVDKQVRSRRNVLRKRRMTKLISEGLGFGAVVSYFSGRSAERKLVEAKVVKVNKTTVTVRSGPRDYQHPIDADKIVTLVKAAPKPVATPAFTEKAVADQPQDDDNGDEADVNASDEPLAAPLPAAA